MNISPIKRLVSRFLSDAPDDQAFALSPANVMQSGLNQADKNTLNLPMQKLDYAQSKSIELSSVNGSNGRETVQRKPDFGQDWLFNVANRMQQIENGSALLAIAVTEIQPHLNVDRVLIYQFQGEHQGTVVAESIANGYTPSLNESLPSIAFGAERRFDYQHQPFVAMIAAPELLTPYQVQLLERFQVKASLSLPIVVDRQLWGLLVVQQCTSTLR